MTPEVHDHNLNPESAVLYCIVHGCMQISLCMQVRSVLQVYREAVTLTDKQLGLVGDTDSKVGPTIEARLMCGA